MAEAGLDHGLVSNGRVLALIGPDGGVAWYCAPRFDSPALFCGLLDPARGGRFVIEVEGQREVRQAYHRDSLALRTTLVGAAGAVAVDDVCPFDDSPRLIRWISAIEGAPRVRVVFDPRPDYGRDPARAKPSVTGWTVGDAALRIEGDGVDVEAVTSGGWWRLDRPLGLVLDRRPASATGLPAAVAVDHANRTWRGWLDGLSVGSDPIARRSALTLAALVYRPTGAMIAAATTSVPEAIGEPRNWDYRYCWIRDGAFAAEALLRLGDRAAARAFLTFLWRAIGDGPVQPLYRVDGDRSIPEEILPHLAGFADTGPVRVGNAAAGQIQHDTHGQIVWLAERIVAAGGALDRAMLPWLWARVEAAAAARGVPDAGIWEFRDRPGQYTFSHLWCWVALDRGAKLAAAMGEAKRAGVWAALAATQREAMLAAATRAGFFAQTLDGTDVDASSLAVAPMGLVDPADPRYRATIDRCEEALLVDGLMKRYVARDDFGATTSTFSLCTLWWIEALAASGQTERARGAFSAFLSHRNPHGLFSEDIDPKTGRLLGNFPQAYTHIGILSALHALGGRG